jgi:hypothetical protein
MTAPKSKPTRADVKWLPRLDAHAARRMTRRAITGVADLGWRRPTEGHAPVTGPSWAPDT